MSLSSSTLSAIQKAGAAIFTADAKLKNTVKEYADRVNAAMGSNPYGLANDALFENWKTVARLSQTITGIEEEIKKVFQVASELTADDQPSVVQVLSLAAPTRSVKKGVVSQIDLTPTATNIKTKKPTSKSMSRTTLRPESSIAQSMGNQNDQTPTDVVVKSKKKTSNPKTSVSKLVPSPIPAKAAKAAKPVKAANIPSEAGSSLKISGNPAKLLSHFERVLNTNEFTVISQTAAGQETGIPLGSMTAATKKLVESGRIIAGPMGSFKLANVQQPLAQ